MEINRTAEFDLVIHTPVDFFTKEINSRLAKRKSVFNGRLANRWLTFLFS